MKEMTSDSVLPVEVAVDNSNNKVTAVSVFAKTSEPMTSASWSPTEVSSGNPCFRYRFPLKLKISTHNSAIDTTLLTFRQVLEEKDFS